MHEQLTRREALVAALAATTLGSGALLRPALCTRRHGHGPHRRDHAAVEVGRSVGGRQRAQDRTAVAIDWVNSRGGLDGQRVDARGLRRQGRSGPRRQNFVRAVNHDHCSVILAGWDSGVALAEMEEAHKLGSRCS